MRGEVNFAADIQPTFAPRVTLLVDLLGRILPDGWSAEAFESCDHRQSVVVMGDDETLVETYAVTLSNEGYELFVVNEDTACVQVAPMSLRQVAAAITARIATQKALLARAA